MVRLFPRTPGRQRWIVLVTCVVVALPGAVASAEDLKDKRREIGRDVRRAAGQLDESSAELRQATAALQRAQARLDVAEATLARTRGQVTAAAILDRQMQARLDAAVRDLQLARDQLARGRRELREQRDEMGRLAAESYQGGSPQLLGLTAIFRTGDPRDLTAQLNAASNLMDKQAMGYDRLRAAAVLLEITEQRVREIKNEVAVQRAAAAANLARKQALEQQAEEQAAEVATLVAGRAQAQAAAERVKQRDLRVLRQLEKERDRIAAILRKRALAAKRRALAAGKARGGSATGFLSPPVDGYLTSDFGWRTHPIFGYRSFHDGIDFGAGRCGAPIRATADGVVVSSYYQTAYGNRLIIDQGWVAGGGLATIYNHSQRYTVGEGSRVRRGQVIGYVGSTGWSTGCHLHFTVLRNGSPVDPSRWL